MSGFASITIEQTNKALKECGIDRKDRGVVIGAALPSKKSFDAMLARYAPGCGAPMHVAGTNGGTMPCGGFLSWQGKDRKQEFCGHCKPL